MSGSYREYWLLKAKNSAIQQDLLVEFLKFFLVINLPGLNAKRIILLVFLRFQDHSMEFPEFGGHHSLRGGKGGFITNHQRPSVRPSLGVMFTLTVLGVSFLVLGAFKFLYSIKAPPSWSTFQRIFITICHFGFRFSNPPVLRVALFFSGITSKSSSKESFFIVSKSALKPSDGVWLHNFKETPLYHLEKTASRLDANGHVIPPPQIHLDAVILHVHGGAFVAGSSRNMVNAHLSLLERIHSQYGKK